MLPTDSGLPHPRRAEPARFCFRYRPHWRHASAYDVFIELDGPGAACHIEIHHADVVAEERRPFTSGALNARRLGSAVALLGLVDRVARKDRSRMVPGSLVFSARLKQPYVLPPSVATRLRMSGAEDRYTQGVASAVPPATGPLAHHTVHGRASLRAMLDLPRARARHRYPLRSL